MPTTGSNGQPLFTTSDAVRIAAYLTQISNYAALVGNRKVGTTAQRLAASETNGNAWQGLQWKDTTDGNEYERSSSASWVLTGTDSNWQLSTITIAAGWGTRTDPSGGTADRGNGGVRRVDQFVELRFRVTRTGATLTSSSSGNIPDTSVGVIPSAYAPSSTVYGNVHLPGSALGSVRVQTDGTVVLTDLYPNNTIAAGTVIQVSAFWFLS